MFAGCAIVLVFVTSSLAYRDRDDYIGPKERFMDFSIEVPSNTKECFYQDMDDRFHGMYMQYLVLYQGPYEDLHFTISGPDGKFLFQAVGEYEEFQINITDSRQKGTYEMCLENQYLLEETVVYVEMWVEYNDSLDKLVDTHSYEDLGNVTTSLKKISDRVQRMDLHAGLISQWYHKDSVTLKFSDSHVDSFGMLVCAMIICSGLLQAFFIKKLFLRDQEELRNDPPVKFDQPRKSSGSRIA
ncbi:uncharacterized protein LOC144860204 [Branchiostoma floridae x Branchiostoma japonicum]